MNQEQRKYLIDQVNKTSTEQIDELKKQIPKEPSLNNYLIAAFLDNTIQFADIDKLKLGMKEKVLAMGHNDSLVHTESDWKNNKGNTYVEVDPSLLFVIPQNYRDARAEYERKKAEIDAKIANIRNMTNTIVMKIQIGSAQALDRLVIQIDNLGDLNLMNNQLQLSAEK